MSFLTTALFFWGIIQSLTVGILIPAVKKVRSNYLLSLIFLILSLNMLLQYLLRFTSVRNQFPRLTVLPDFLDLLLPSLIFGYLIQILVKNKPVNYTLFFLPAILWGTVLLAFILSQDNFVFLSYINTTLHLISLIVVLAWKTILLIKCLPYFRLLRNPLKSKHRKLMMWPRTLILFMGCITYISLCNLTFFLMRKATWFTGKTIKVIWHLVNFNYILFTCFIIFMSIYLFVRHPQVLNGLPSFRFNAKNQDGKKTKRLVTVLEQIERDKLYLDTELNERKLADKLGIHSYVLSKILNDDLGKSFNEFINERRVNEAKSLLKNKENEALTIFAIAIDSGFKSESSFYANFKKLTGVTPLQYKQQSIHR